MTPRKIGMLTPEQEAVIPVYREKWRQIALSTEPIDRQQAIEAVKATYAILGQPEPEIVFFNSPQAAWKELLSQIISQPKEERWNRIQEVKSLTTNFERNIVYELRYQLTPQLEDKLLFHLLRELDIEPLLSNGLELMWSVLDSQSARRLKTSELALAESGICNLSFQDGAYLDFCISVLDCVHDKRKWLVYQTLIKNIGKLFPFKEQAVLCERPYQLLFNTENDLHAEAEPAVGFVDGYSVYVYDGTRLSEKYGKIPPNQWQAKWLLKERNAEQRRVLIQCIGYARITQELQAIELDSYREYTLSKIEKNVDVEPIYLLKMTCPSTKMIYVLRVPPNMKSAREAIRWVNWGIDPEDFAVQT